MSEELQCRRSSSSRCCNSTLRRLHYKRQKKRKRSTFPSCNYNNKNNRIPRISCIGAISAIISLRSRPHIFVASSSSNSGNSSNNNNSNAPFMVMSEITVHDGHQGINANIVDNDDSKNNLADVDDEADYLKTPPDSYQDASNVEKDDTVDKSSKEQFELGSTRSKHHSNFALDKKSDTTNSFATDNEGSGSDTDGEDDADVNNFDPSPLGINTLDSANSQPLRTLKRLQAMLDDSDYATHTVSSEPVVGSSISSRKVGNKDPPPPSVAADSAAVASLKSSNPPPQPPPDKLWTSKDRAKYRRTLRAEKQLQLQQKREQRAREIRDIQRQRIIREERERKDMEELRRKQSELLERQRQEQQRHQQAQQQAVNHFEEASTDVTDDDTDGMGFELPNNPVYLSDGEATETEDFSEEQEDSFRQRQPKEYPNSHHQSYRQPYQYNNYQRPPPPPPPPHQANKNNNPYPEYQHYRLLPHHGQHQPPFSPPRPQNMHQYQFNSNQQQMQYEQNYAAWAQAAANGYFYPPPTPPGSYLQQYPYTSNGQPQQQNQLPHQQPLQHQIYSHDQDHPSYEYINPHQTGAPLDQRWAPHQQQLPPQYGVVVDRTASRSSNVQAILPPSTTNEPWFQSAVRSNENIVVPPKNDEVGPTSSQIMTVQPSVILPQSPLIPLGPINAEGTYNNLENESAVVIAGAASRISFDSVQKLGFATLGVALMSYCAVSPRTVPHPEYNRLFLQNLSIVWLAAIAPIVSLVSVYDGRYNNINTAIGTFYVSLTLGYTLAFVFEVIVTTIVRLGVFKIWEPDIFSLTYDVPTPILPWVLREKAYKPKRITLFAADFAASCVASPIIEEYLKLKICQLTSDLPRNFKPLKTHKSRRKQSKKNIVQAVRSINAPQVTNINCYVVQMLAASLGLKLSDITRRILMYTKRADEHKHFFAVARGVYPLHELCGTMTALLLARRDVLGVNLPIWKIVGPAIIIHGLANFRGMKPIFKWNSSTPWSEMQLSPFKIGSDFSFTHLIPTSYGKIGWTIILCRVFGFCLKNYYLTGRQAMKRTTTYSGKLHAFDAKLQTDSFLKKSKKDNL